MALIHAHVQAGGLAPLLDLMASRNGNLQHNAAFALYGLADNEDNIAAIVREGGVRTLQDCEQSVQVLCPTSSLHLSVAAQTGPWSVRRSYSWHQHQSTACMLSKKPVQTGFWKV